MLSPCLTGTNLDGIRLIGNGSKLSGGVSPFKEVIETFVDAHQITEASLPISLAVLDERL